MEALSILDSNHAIFESGIMTRRRSRNILHDGITANPQAMSKVICTVLLYSTKLEQELFYPISFTGRNNFYMAN